MRIYAINLDPRSDRWTEFNRRNSHAGYLYRQPACGESPQTTRYAAERGWIDEDDARITPRAHAQITSHLRLWETIDPSDPPIVICEDDAVFNLNFNELATDVIDGLEQEYDFVAWGINHACPVQLIHPGNWLQQRAYFVQEQDAGWSERYKTTCFLPTLCRLVAASATTAYTINPECVDEIIKAITPVRSIQMQFPEENSNWRVDNIDSALCRILPEMNAYITWPPLSINDDDKRRANKPPERLDPQTTGQRP